MTGMDSGAAATVVRERAASGPGAGISAVILAYGEAENLRFLLPAVRENLAAVGVPFELVVVDAAAPLDDTPAVCEALGARYVNQDRPGFGGAFRTGIRAAALPRFLILDGDGSHDPARIPAIARAFDEGGCDVVIGSRYAKGGKTHDAPTSVLMSRALNLAFRLCLGIRAKDVSTDYRLYDSAQLRAVEPELAARDYDVLQEVLLRMRLRNRALRIGEVPIEFRKRVFGTSKRRLLPFIASYLRSLARLTAVRFLGRRADAGLALVRSAFLYGVFGLAAAGLDYGTFALLAGPAGAPPEAANVAGVVVGFAAAFLANTFLNFRRSDRLLRRFLSYGAVCLLGLALSTTAISLLKDRVDLYLLKAVVLAAVSLLQFVLNRSVTYR